MEKIGVAYWRAKAADLADKAQDNHGISAQKFHLLREFLSLGYRVLLSGAAGVPTGHAACSSSRFRETQTSTSSRCRIRSIFWRATLMWKGCPTVSTSEPRMVCPSQTHTSPVPAMLKSRVTGYVDGIDDPGMGWARYAQTIRIFVLNSGLFYIQPSERTVRFLRVLPSA